MQLQLYIYTPFATNPYCIFNPSERINIEDDTVTLKQCSRAFCSRTDAVLLCIFCSIIFIFIFVWRNAEDMCLDKRVVQRQMDVLVVPFVERPRVCGMDAVSFIEAEDYSMPMGTK